jgi:hypothetical protein
MREGIIMEVEVSAVQVRSLVTANNQRSQRDRICYKQGHAQCLGVSYIIMNDVGNQIL